MNIMTPNELEDVRDACLKTDDELIEYINNALEESMCRTTKVQPLWIPLYEVQGYGTVFPLKDEEVQRCKQLLTDAGWEVDIRPIGVGKRAYIKPISLVDVKLPDIPHVSGSYVQRKSWFRRLVDWFRR